MQPALCKSDSGLSVEHAHSGWSRQPPDTPTRDRADEHPTDRHSHRARSESIPPGRLHTWQCASREWLLQGSMEIPGGDFVFAHQTGGGDCIVIMVDLGDAHGTGILSDPTPPGQARPDLARPDLT